MCDCIKNIEKSLKEAFDKEVKSEEYITPQLDNKCLMLSKGSIELNGFCEVLYKNGKQNKKWKRHVKFNNCPFCGEKYN